MKTIRKWAIHMTTAALPLFALPVAAYAQAESTQAFPSKPIKIVVPFPAGGSTDMLARMIGQKFTEYWNQPVVVENRPGASGWIGASAVAKAPADGYTFALTISSIVYAPSLYSKIPFDVHKDFEPVSLVSKTPNVFVVPTSFPAKSVDEFVEYVRKNPGKHNYGSFGQGTTSHIFGETLKLDFNLDLVHVPYKGAAPLLNDLLGAQVSSGFIDAGTIRSQVDSGKVRLLAVSGVERVGSLPNVPTFLELGHKGFEPVGYFLALAPAGTPSDIVTKLADGIAKAVRSPDVAAKVRELGQEAVGSTPQELKGSMTRDAEQFERAIKRANIKVES